MGIFRFLFGPRLELRPHHVQGYLDYLRYLSDPKREKDYLKHWRKMVGIFHSDKVVRHWEAIVILLDNNKRFKYVPGYDSVCKECEHSGKCHNLNHEYFKIVKEADDYAIKYMPELKFGKTYNGKFLRELFKAKGWLK